jgi:hypothetical protein
VGELLEVVAAVAQVTVPPETLMQEQEVQVQTQVLAVAVQQVVALPHLAVADLGLWLFDI